MSFTPFMAMFLQFNVRMWNSAQLTSHIIYDEYNALRNCSENVGHNNSSISVTCLFTIASPVQYIRSSELTIYFLFVLKTESVIVCYGFCVCSSQHFRWHSICCYAQCLFNRSIGIRMYFNGILFRKRNKSFIESRKILSNETFCTELCDVYLKLINYIRYSEVNYFKKLLYDVHRNIVVSSALW